MSVPEYLQKVFRRDPETGNVIVEILLEKYIYAFNEWDSSYFKRRDLDPDLIHYLDSCSDEIPYDFGLDLLFTVSQPRDEELEKRLETSVKNYFLLTVSLQHKTLRDAYRRSVKYVAMALGFLLAATFLGRVMPDRIIAQTLVEGLSIGGWVFLWEAFSVWSFDRSKIKGVIKEYERLANARVFFTYGPTPWKNQMADNEGFPDGSGARKKEAIAPEKGRTT